MEIEKLAVTLPEGYDPKEPITLIVREGTAPAIKQKQKLQRNDIAIHSVMDYVNTRAIATPIEENLGLIVYSHEPTPFIQYLENPNDQEATDLKAVLIVHPDYDAWGINEGRQFNQKQLEKHIRKLAHCFASEEIARQLILSLQNFEVRYEQIVTKEDNRQGQKKDIQEEAIKFSKGELPKAFDLLMPIFKNTSPVAIQLEIEIDKGPNNMPVYSFYSLDVEIKKKELAEQIINNEVSRVQGRIPMIRV